VSSCRDSSRSIRRALTSRLFFDLESSGEPSGGRPGGGLPAGFS